MGKRKRRWLIVLGSLLGLGLIAQLWISTRLDPSVERWIKETVAERSRGLYLVDSLEVNIDIWPGIITLKNVHLRPDSLRFLALKARGEAPFQLLELRIPYLSVGLKEGLDALRKNRWHASYLHMEQPQISLRRLEAPPQNDSTRLVRRRPLSRMPEIKMERVEIEGGSFSYIDTKEFSQNAFQAKSVNALFKQVAWNNLQALFSFEAWSSEEFNLDADIADYSFLLPDSTYSLQAKRLGISGSKEEIFAENLRLQPQYDRLAARNGRRIPPNLFDIQLPRLEVKGLDLEEVWYKRELNLSEVILHQPILTQLSKIRPEAVDPEVLDLRTQYDKLAKTFKRIVVGEIAVEKGNYYQQASLRDSTRTLALEGIDLRLKQFSLDSLLLEKDDRLLFSEEIEVNLEDYALLFPQKDYSIRGSETRFSTTEQELSSQNIRLIPSRKLLRAAKFNGQDVFSFQLPKLRVSGLDLTEAWYDRLVDVQQVVLSSPQMQLRNDPQLNREAVDSLAKANLYLLIDDYLESLTIRNFLIQGGSFSFNRGDEGMMHAFLANEIEMYVQNFQLDERAQERTSNPFYADDIDMGLEIDRYRFLLPDSSYALEVRHIGISTADSSLYADSLWFLPQGPDAAGEAQAFLPRISLTGLDVKKAYFDHILELDQLAILHPQIWTPVPAQEASNEVSRAAPIEKPTYIPVGEEILPQYFKELNIGKVSLEEGLIHLRHRKEQELVERAFPHCEIVLHEVRLDSATRMDTEQLFFAKSWEAGGRDWQWTLNDELHQLSLGDIHFSSEEQVLSIGGLQIQPDSSRLEETASRLRYQLGIPALHLGGIKAGEIWYDRTLDLHELTLEGPSLALTRYPRAVRQTFDSLQRADLFRLIEPYFYALEVDNMRVKDGALVLNAERKDANHAFSAHDLSMLVAGFKLDPTSKSTKRAFYADNIQMALQAEDYSFLLPDSTYRIEVDQLRLNTADSSLYAKNISLIPRLEHPKNQPKTHIWSFEVPQMWASGVKVADIYLGGKLDLHHIRFHEPDIMLRTRPEKTGRGKDPYLAVLPVFDYVGAHTIEITDGRLEEVRTPADSVVPWNIGHFDLELEEFFLDSLGLLRPDRMFYADEVAMLMEKYRIPALDSLYWLNAKRLGLSSRDKLLFADSLQLDPMYDPEAFVEKFGYTMNDLHLLSDRVNLYGIKLFELFKYQYVRANRVDLIGLHLEVSKDNRFDPDPARKPPFPQEVLMGLGYPIHFDSVMIREGTLAYTEYINGMGPPGYFSLSDLQASLQDITNDPMVLESREAYTATARASARMMGSGFLQVDFSYPLTDTAFSYEINGQLGSVDMQEFNSILQPTTAIRIDSGLVNKGNFRVRGDRHGSKGKMWLHYNDLNVSVLEEDEDEAVGDVPKFRRRRFASAIANSLVVKTDNPNRRFLRVGRISYEVDTSKGFIYHWVQSVVSGVQSSVGLKNEEEKDKKLGLKGLAKTLKELTPDLPKPKGKGDKPKE